MTGAREPVPGEITYKPVNHSRREGRDVSAEPVVPTPCIYSHGGHGGGELPAFPAPSVIRGGEIPVKTRAQRAARTRRCVTIGMTHDERVAWLPPPRLLTRATLPAGGRVKTAAPLYPLLPSLFTPLSPFVNRLLTIDRAKIAG